MSNRDTGFLTYPRGVIKIKDYFIEQTIPTDASMLCVHCDRVIWFERTNECEEFWCHHCAAQYVANDKYGNLENFKGPQYVLWTVAKRATPNGTMFISYVYNQNYLGLGSFAYDKNHYIPAADEE